MYRRFGKRALDVVCSAAGIVLLSPLLLALAVWVKLDSPGPVLFRQKRVGKGKTLFSILKFRTMYADTPKDVPTHLLQDPDAMITRCGRFLRRTSLDELPQLFNILSGKLSLVGPRPVLQEETELYGAQRELLLSCKPGLTGLWQARGRSNVTYENGQRQALELQYVATRSFWLDIKIMFWTVGAVLRMDGAR